MNSLKELKLSEVTGEKNIENFDLDVRIIKYRKENGVLRNNDTFCKKNNITSSKLGGRVVSLISRGHLERSKSITTIKTLKNGTSRKDSRITTNIKLNIIKAFKNGVKNNVIVSEFGVSLASVSRLKSIFKHNTNDKNDNSYTNDKGVNKEVARNKMAKYFIDSNINGNILTLPYLTAKIERKILVDQPNQTFIGVENNEGTFNEMKSYIKKEKLPIEPYFGEFSDKIYGMDENEYAGICGDYCGGMGKQSKEVEYVLKNKLVKSGGVIALTFRKPLRGKNKHDKAIFGNTTISNNTKDNRCQSDKAMESHLYRMMGTEYDLVEIFNYKDKKDNGNYTQEMVLFVIKRR